jgi:hypothetical protein
MDNPETQVTLTQDTEQRQIKPLNTTKKTKMMSNTYPNKNRG